MLGGSWGSKDPKGGVDLSEESPTSQSKKPGIFCCQNKTTKENGGQVYGQLFLLWVCGKARVRKTWSKEKDIEQSWIWSKKERGLAKNRQHPSVCLALCLTPMTLRVMMLLITSIFQGFHQFLF